MHIWLATAIRREFECWECLPVENSVITVCCESFSDVVVIEVNADCCEELLLAIKRQSQCAWCYTSTLRSCCNAVDSVNMRTSVLWDRKAGEALAPASAACSRKIKIRAVTLVNKDFFYFCIFHHFRSPSPYVIHSAISTNESKGSSVVERRSLTGELFLVCTWPAADG